MSNQVMSVLFDSPWMDTVVVADDVGVEWQYGAVSIKELRSGAVIYIDPTGRSIACPNGLWIRENFLTGDLSIHS